MSKINIILIGGNGFIGKFFKEFLDKNLFNLIIIGRSKVENSSKDSTYFVSNNELYHNISNCIENSPNSIIIDLAYTSVPNTSFDNPVKDFSENLTNVINYLDLAKKLNVKKYIYISSGGTVYGDHGHKLLNENTVNFPISPYGITKLACERYVNMYFSAYKVPTVIVRPANVFGPGQKPFRGQGLVSTVMGNILLGKPIKVFGGDEIYRDYVFIEDFCKALLDVINFGEVGEIYNVGSGEGISLNQILHDIEQTTLPLQIKSRENLEVRPFDIKCNILDYTKLNQLNNWQPTTKLSQGLQLTWNWVQEYMNVNNLV